MSDRFINSGTEVRLLDQYRESVRLKALLNSLIDGPSVTIQSALQQLKGRLDIDSMVGAQLDGIGSIIGRPRPFVLDFAEAGDAFEFKDIPNPSDPTRSFGSLTVPDSGGKFAALTGNILMADGDYRILLRAAIFSNTTAATVPDIEVYGTAVLGFPVTVVNTLNQISIQISGRLSPVQRTIIRETLVAAAGIGIDSISFGTSPDSFTFDGPSGTGFGSLTDPQVGSGFARLLSTV